MFSPFANDIQRFALNDSEIHLWYALASATDHARQAGRFSTLLDPEEIRRHAAFINHDAQFEYLATRAFVRTMLGRYLNVPPESLRFQKNEFDRPELVGPAGRPHPLQFNVSHSGGLIACAITWRREIGLDVENTRGSPVDEEVARRHFAEVEFQDYQRQPTIEARHARFLEYWTLKESYLKARGTGLSLPLEKFACHWSNPNRVHLTIDPVLRDDAATWQLQLLRPTPDYVGAVAARIEKAESVRIVERFATID